MITEGDLILLRFPQTDLAEGKLRPVLLLKRVPNEFDDWLVCMVSTQLNQQIRDLEIILSDTDADFPDSGLKATSLIRSSRLAVIDQSAFEGKLGTIGQARFVDIRKRVASWILGESESNQTVETTPDSAPR